MNQNLRHSKKPSWKFFCSEPHLEVLENFYPNVDFIIELISLTNYIIKFLRFYYHKIYNSTIKIVTKEHNNMVTKWKNQGKKSKRKLLGGS